MSDFDLLAASGTSLFGPVADQTFKKRLAPPPNGDRYGQWGLDQQQVLRMPGGSVLTFDLSRLTLADYRQMRTDYQINASLLILTGMLAQTDWSCYTPGQEKSDRLKKQSDALEEGIRRQWLPLIRAWSQALWAGYAPTALVYELNETSKYYEITKYKDLVPEFCRVKWQIDRMKDGTEIRSYDGIVNSGRTIPADNTFWYPMLMENGDHYGRKLLKPAFQPWFFSQLMHLFTNRYYERFGEPTAVGYYPPGETVKDADGNEVAAREVMAGVLSSLRNRGVVTIPSERDPESGDLEWDIKYLESQMRGADFDRYLARLDEEKSLSIFTPVLLFRTGERGSYALGAIHERVFQWMLNMLVNDFKPYVDNFLLRPLTDINFGVKAPRTEIRFRALGRISDQSAQSTLQALIQNGGARLSELGLKDLGDYLGIDLEYLAMDTAANPNPLDPNATPPATDKGKTAPAKAAPKTDSKTGKPIKASTQGAQDHLRAAYDRLDGQISKAFEHDGFDRDRALGRIKLGYKQAFINDLSQAGSTPAEAESLFNALEGVVTGALRTAKSESDARTAVRTAYTSSGVVLD